MAVVPPDSLALIASLLQSDLAELRQQHAHDPQATAASDEDDAFALYEQELAGLVQAEQDDQVARSLAAAAVTDGPLLQALAREEEAARQDRALALQLSTDIDEDGDDELMPQDYYDRAGEAVAPPQGLDPPPVASTSNSSSSPIQQRSECVACTDTFLSSDLIRAPCKHGHPYCGGCLHDLFVAATKDESLFPPRCETVQIPLDLVKPHLSPQELFEYQRSAIEFRTPDRLYCSTTTCSAFLGSASGTRTAIECRTCRRSTCAACKTPWHGLFGPCGVSPEDAAVQALERDFEYKQCPSCKRVVELESGCHHISCRCGFEFCYLCAAEWQTCDCPLWEERRLLVARDAYGEEWLRRGAAAGGPMDFFDGPPFDGEPLEEALARQVPDDVIEEGNVCEHAQAVKRMGPGQCEVCREDLGRFIMRCTFCHIDLCVRCRRNRGRRPRR